MASRFYIANEKGARWGLNSPAEGVFTEPKGFGFEYSSSYLQVGDLWLPDSRQLVQPEPSGKILFPWKQYETFQKFAGFLNTAESLVLIYQPSGIGTEYFAEIDLVSIDKGGFNRHQQFEVPVQFTCKSLFYTEEKFEYHIERAAREMRFDFMWDTKFNDLNYIYFEFQNDGHVKSPFALSFGGYCTNPEMTVFQDGKTVHSVKFNVTLQASERLTLSTFDDDLYINVNGIDRKDVLDFTNENFFKIPMGASEIYFRSQAGKMNNIVMNLEKYYKGV